jgi:hypothetical protein
MTFLISNEAKKQLSIDNGFFGARGAIDIHQFLQECADPVAVEELEQEL